MVKGKNYEDGDGGSSGRGPNGRNGLQKSAGTSSTVVTHSKVPQEEEYDDDDHEGDIGLDFADAAEDLVPEVINYEERINFSYVTASSWLQFLLSVFAATMLYDSCGSGVWWYSHFLFSLYVVADLIICHFFIAPKEEDFKSNFLEKRKSWRFYKLVDVLCFFCVYFYMASIAIAIREWNGLAVAALFFQSIFLLIRFGLLLHLLLRGPKAFFWISVLIDNRAASFSKASKDGVWSMLRLDQGYLLKTIELFFNMIFISILADNKDKTCDDLNAIVIIGVILIVPSLLFFFVLFVRDRQRQTRAKRDQELMVFGLIEEAKRSNIFFLTPKLEFYRLKSLLKKKIAEEPSLLSIETFGKIRMGEGEWSDFTAAIGQNTAIQKLNFRENPQLPWHHSGLAQALSRAKVKILEFPKNDLTDSHIQTLSTGLKTLTVLEHISLYENKITHVGVHALVENIKALPQLKSLNLRNNPLDWAAGAHLGVLLENSTTLNSLVLEKCGLGPRGLQDLSKSLGARSHVEKLELSDNACGSSGCSALFRALETNVFLKKLKLKANNIDYRACETIGKTLQRNQALDLITLSENPIGGQGIVPIIRGLENNATLISLDVSKCKIDDTISEMKSLLQSNLDLRIFDFSDNPINDQGIVGIAAYLKSRLIVQRLYVSSLQMTNIGEDRICDALLGNANLKEFIMDSNPNSGDSGQKLFQVFSKCQNLSIVSLKGKKFTPESAAKMGKGIEMAPRLQILALEECNLNGSILAPICEGARNNLKLAKLSLNKNSLDVNAANVLGRFLEESRSIQEIELAECNIGDQQMDAMSVGLKKSPNLYYVNLNKNQISVQGGYVFAEMISTNKGIQILELANNRIGTSTTSIAEVLMNTKGCRLEELDLEDNNIEQSSADMLYQALRENRYLRRLSIKSNPFNPEKFTNLYFTNPLLEIEWTPEMLEISRKPTSPRKKKDSSKKNNKKDEDGNGVPMARGGEEEEEKKRGDQVSSLLNE